MGDTVSLQRLGCGAGHHGLGHSDRPARGAAAARRKLPAATVTARPPARAEPTGRSASSRQEKLMDNAARTRQRVAALSLPIAAVLYISAEALSPKGTDQVIQTTATAFKVLAIAAKHPTQLYVAGSFALLGLGALAVWYAAIATLVRSRGSAVATVAVASRPGERPRSGCRQRTQAWPARLRRGDRAATRPGVVFAGGAPHGWYVSHLAVLISPGLLAWPCGRRLPRDC